MHIEIAPSFEPEVICCVS